MGLADGQGAEPRKHGEIRGLSGRELKAEGHGEGLGLGEGLGGVAAGCHRSVTDPQQRWSAGWPFRVLWTASPTCAATRPQAARTPCRTPSEKTWLRSPSGRPEGRCGVMMKPRRPAVEQGRDHPPSRSRQKRSVCSTARAQLPASVRPELRLGLKLWSPWGIHCSCSCGDRA